MYVGNDYVEEEMPEGNYSAFATKDELKNLKVFNLFDIKTMSEQIATKDWACISYDTQNKLDKADVPTAYNFLKEKLDDVDKEYVSWQTTTLNVIEAKDGYWYYIDNSNYYRCETLDRVNEELIATLPYNYAYIFKCVLENQTVYIAGYAYTDIQRRFTIFDENFNSIYEEVGLQASGLVDRIKNYYVIDNKIICLSSNGQYIYEITIDTEITINTIDTNFSNRSSAYGYGAKNSNWVFYNDKYYIATSYSIKSFSPNNPSEITNSTETVFNNSATENYKTNAQSLLAVCKGKLTIICFADTDGWGHFSNICYQLNNDTFTTIYSSTDYSSETRWISQYNDTFYISLYYSSVGGILVTTDFIEFRYIYNTYSSWINVVNNGNVFSSSNYATVYADFARKIYTDTINGTDIKYYKNGDWKICTPDIAVGNDTNLQTVYEYLGYLNYWWIDTVNEQITLQRNSNRWTFMYVGDNYEDSSLPSGSFEGIATKEELRELIPDQTGNNGKFLTTNGSTMSWAEVQSGGGGTTTWFSSCSIDNSTSTTATDIAVNSKLFTNQISTDGTYTFSYDGSNWELNGNNVDLEDYGISFDGTATSGDTIVVQLASIAGNTLDTGLGTINTVLINGLEQVPLVDYRVSSGVITFTTTLLISDYVGVK